MASFPQAARRALALAALLGCVPLLLADSADDPPCTTLNVDQAYDVALTCPADQTYRGRVRFQGGVDNVDPLKARVESGAIEGIDVRLEGTCYGDDTIVRSVALSFRVMTDRAGNRYVEGAGKPPTQGGAGGAVAGAGGQAGGGSAGTGGQAVSAAGSGGAASGAGGAPPQASIGSIRVLCRTAFGAEVGQPVLCETYDERTRVTSVVEGCTATVTGVP